MGLSARVPYNSNAKGGVIGAINYCEQQHVLQSPVNENVTCTALPKQGLWHYMLIQTVFDIHLLVFYNHNSRTSIV